MLDKAGSIRSSKVMMKDNSVGSTKESGGVSQKISRLAQSDLNSYTNKR